MIPSKQAVSDPIYLRDGRISLQREDIPLASSHITCELAGDWIFQVSIPSDFCQLVLHTWQRMIHEPTYHHSQTGYTTATSYQSTASYRSVASAETASDQVIQDSSDPSQSPVPPEKQVELTSTTYAQVETKKYAPGAQIGFVGNNERQQRRIIYLEGIRKMEIAVDTFEIGRAILRFHCDASGGLESILYINDGIGSTD